MRGIRFCIRRFAIRRGCRVKNCRRLNCSRSSNDFHHFLTPGPVRHAARDCPSRSSRWRCAWRAFFRALHTPSSVFPQTDFPRVVVLVNNGIMPADEMMATITRPDRGGDEETFPARSPCARPPSAARPRSTSSSTGAWTCSSRSLYVLGRLVGNPQRPARDGRHRGFDA